MTGTVDRWLLENAGRLMVDFQQMSGLDEALGDVCVAGAACGAARGAAERRSGC